MQNQKWKCQETGFHMHASIATNSLRIRTIRPKEKLLYIITHHKIPFPMMQYSKVAVHRQLEQKVSKEKVVPFRCYFFTCGWINGHNSALLAPINFYLMLFYSSCGYNSDGIWRNHVTQNGRREQVLQDLDTTTTQHVRFITLCQVSPCICSYIRTYFTLQESLCSKLLFEVWIGLGWVYDWWNDNRQCKWNKSLCLLSVINLHCLFSIVSVGLPDLLLHAPTYIAS